MSIIDQTEDTPQLVVKIGKEKNCLDCDWVYKEHTFSFVGTYSWQEDPESSERERHVAHVLSVGDVLPVALEALEKGEWTQFRVKQIDVIVVPSSRHDFSLLTLTATDFTSHLPSEPGWVPSYTQIEGKERFVRSVKQHPESWYDYCADYFASHKSKLRAKTSSDRMRVEILPLGADEANYVGKLYDYEVKYRVEMRRPASILG